MVAHPQIAVSTLDHLKSLGDNTTQLQRAVGHGQPALRDASGNILVMNPAASNPLLVAQGHDVALNMAPSTVLGNTGTLTITDETGQHPRPIVASNFYGDVGDPTNGNIGPTGGHSVWSDTHGVHTGNTNGLHSGDVINGKHYGEIGQAGQAWNAYITVHGDSNGTHNGQLNGDSYGVHHGEVGTPSEAHTTYGDSHGTLFGEHGVPGQGWHSYITCHGNVGVGGDNWTLFGTVVAPSERSLKAEIRGFPDAGALIDAIPVYRWRWATDAHDDGHDHAGPMVDDFAEHAPWLVRATEGTTIRSLADRDLIGVLWAALRESRGQVTALEDRVTALEELATRT